MMAERQVRYNIRRPERGSEVNEIFFLFINEEKDADKIKNKVYSLFAPIEDEVSTIKGECVNKKLKYELIRFSSATRVEDYLIKGIYNGMHHGVIRDFNLYPRTKRTIDSYISKYVDN